MWPVLQRELRAESRNPVFRRLRLVTVLAVMGVIGLYLSQVSGLAAQSGQQLFVIVHVTVGLFLLAVCPLLTADCLSRERREGTMGLLFLTPLRPGEIVLGKAAIHLLRAFALWLAAVPVMAIPFLFGGVSVGDLALALLLELSVVATGLSAGVFASILTKRAELAVLFAYLLTAGWLGGAFMIAGGVLALVSFFRSGPHPLLTAGAFALFAGCGAMLHLWLTVIRLPRIWQSDTQPAQRKPPSVLMSPPRSLAGWVRRRRLRLLGRNPLIWLQTRYLPSALGRWGWVSLVGTAWILQLDGGWGIHQFDAVRRMEFMILFGMVAVSARALHAERQSGTLELLLVSPIRVGQLRLSVAQSLWHQFGPAILLELAIWMMVRGFVPDEEASLGPDAVVISSLVVLPFIGARCAARHTHFLGALLATGFVGVLVPIAVPAWFLWILSVGRWIGEGWAASGIAFPAPDYSAATRGWSVFVQAILGVAAIQWMNREFRDRRFIVRAVG
jgi:ABC-type transport system involved in multi-copper enzyme maturation permease subunit